MQSYLNFSMATTQKLEDITSKEHLNKALENAKFWCLNNLPEYLQDFKNVFDYSIFCYVIDNGMIGCDMKLDEKQEGLIRVSTRKLKWYQEREDCFRKHGMRRYAKRGNETVKIEGAVEIDPESMFVHEITEFALFKLELFDLTTYLSKYFGRAHEIAYEMENINRRGRGLKEWPKIS